MTSGARVAAELSSFGSKAGGRGCAALLHHAAPLLFQFREPVPTTPLVPWVLQTTPEGTGNAPPRRPVSDSPAIMATLARGKLYIMPTKRLFSANALAFELDQDRRAISQALATVPPDSTDKAGSPRWYLATALPHLPLGAGSVEDERRRWFKARAARAELELAREEGRYVLAEDAEETWRIMASAIHAGLLAVPGIAAPQCAGRSAREVRAVLERVIYGRLEALAATKVVSVPSGQGGYEFTDLEIEP